MSIEYEDRVNPLTAFLHEQAKKAEQEQDGKAETEGQHETEIMGDETKPAA